MNINYNVTFTDKCNEMKVKVLVYFVTYYHNTGVHCKINTHFRLLKVPLAFINNHMIKYHHMTETKLLLVQSTAVLIFCLHSFSKTQAWCAYSNMRGTQQQNRNRAVLALHCLVDIHTLIKEFGGGERKQNINIIFGFIVNKQWHTENS